MKIPNHSKPIKKPRTKYGNEKAIIDGIEFDSKKEARRYCDLKILQRAGEISELQCQVQFMLMPSVKFDGEPKAKPALRYTADFVYLDKDGKKIVEDVKSKVTRETTAYRMRKHMMKFVHGLEISEV